MPGVGRSGGGGGGGGAAVLPALSESGRNWKETSVHAAITDPSVLLQEHREGAESGPRLPGADVPLQAGPGAAGLPSAPHRPARRRRHPPPGRRRRASGGQEDPGPAEPGEGLFPMSPF